MDGSGTGAGGTSTFTTGLVGSAFGGVWELYDKISNMLTPFPNMGILSSYSADCDLFSISTNSGRISIPSKLSWAHLFSSIWSRDFCSFGDCYSGSGYSFTIYFTIGM